MLETTPGTLSNEGGRSSKSINTKNLPLKDLGAVILFSNFPSVINLEFLLPGAGDSAQTVRDSEGNKMESGEDYIIAGERPAKPRGSLSIRQRCLQLVEGGLAITASVIAAITLSEQRPTEAKEPNFPDPAPRKPLEVKGGMPSEQIITSYTVKDLQLIGRDRLATLIDLGDLGQYLVSGGLENGKLVLAKKINKLPFLGTAVLTSEDGLIQGALGSSGPGMNEGRLGLYENGGVSVYNNGQGSILDGTVTPDKTGIIVRSGNISAGETRYLYQYFDLATRTFRTFNLCSGCVPGGVGSPLVMTAANISSSYGSGLPNTGYMENAFNNTTLTVSTNQWHPEQGYNRSKSLNHYYNAANEHIVWMVNNDTSDPEDKYQWATLFHNADNVHIAAKDVRPNIPGYPEVQAGQGIWGIAIFAAEADLSGDSGYMLTGFNPQGSVLNYPHVERFSLSNPNDLNKRLIVPEDGDSPPVWPNGGIRGGSGRFVKVLTQGTERYLLRDIRDTGFLIRRITDGITSSDQWKLVTIKGGYSTYQPIVKQQAN